MNIDIKFSVGQNVLVYERGLLWPKKIRTIQVLIGLKAAIGYQFHKDDLGLTTYYTPQSEVFESLETFQEHVSKLSL